MKKPLTLHKKIKKSLTLAISITVIGIAIASVVYVSRTISRSNNLLVPLQATDTANTVSSINESNGLLSFEAENYTLAIPRTHIGTTTSWNLKKVIQGFTGSGYMQILPNPGINDNTAYNIRRGELQYKFNANQPGTYYIWVRGYAQIVHDDTFHMGLNNQITTTADKIHFPQTQKWIWTNQTLDNLPASIQITQSGEHTLNLWMREDGTIVDKIILTNNPKFIATDHNHDPITGNVTPSQTPNSSTPTPTTIITPTLTRTPTPTPTSTSFGGAAGGQIPTSTPTPIYTGNQTQPYVGAPSCPTHNHTSHHGLWDPIRGCHYNHTHNANPTSANDLFGAAGSLWGGQTISYPWQTTSHMGEENTAKHQGYKYIVEKNLPDHRDLNWVGVTPNYVKDVRVQYHALGGVHDAVVRFHSYFMESRICKNLNDLSTCGTAKFGGWNDHGVLHVPYKTKIVPLPNDPVGHTDLNIDPYRAFRTPEITSQIMSWGNASCKGCRANDESTSGDNWSLWTTAPFYGYNQMGGIFFIIFDEWQPINPNNPHEEMLLCDPRKGQACRFNSTEHQLFTAWARIPEYLDQTAQDKDSRPGYITFNGYTNVNTVISNTCSSPSATCVPVEIKNAPVGYASWDNLTNNGKQLDRWHEYDVSPGNEWWVEYPN